MQLEKNYRNLAAAVVGQACEDYCYAIRAKEKYKNDAGQKTINGKKYIRAVMTINECKKFFKSTIYKYMDNPPEYDILLKRLNYVAQHPDEFKVVRFNKNVSSEED